MMHDHLHNAPVSQGPDGRLPWYRTWAGLAVLGAAAAVALYLSLFHVTHVLDALPFLLLLLCPLMHLFMHGGHGHGGHGHGGHGHGGDGGGADDADRSGKGGSP